eukprot:TRINITY_DN8157_c0_g1_i1.p1 TRINITY_DN8157_c0_g1~~TRINITY_DN8157_c0_g1_i1.p1  ORF type:complete len:290 (+),score=27.42 TRINITY_DN8157_c0_g1_i1:13-882(+)
MRKHIKNVLAFALFFSLVFLLFKFSTYTTHYVQTSSTMTVTKDDEVNTNWTNLEHLIVVPGHSVQWCSESKNDIYDESCWFLYDYQKGQVAMYMEHIRSAVDYASQDKSSLLVFSGGQTRKIGPRSEGFSYYSASDAVGWFGKMDVRHRTVTEEYARDSYENLLFSICRFKQMTESYPKHITVFGFPFKSARFTELHREALKYPLRDFTYVSVDSIGLDPQMVDKPFEQFKVDMYGCHYPLFEKKLERNPFKLNHISYANSCPELSPLFDICQNDKESQNNLDNIWNHD